VRKNVNKLVNNFWDKIVDDLSLEEKQKLIKFCLPPEKCKICLSSNAKWYNSLLKEYACDECIPRGCSCRLKKIPNSSGLYVEDYEYVLDKHGKELPCEDWGKI
jgi:hypothetical protein